VLETVSDSWSSDAETSIAQSSTTGPRDDADVGVSRTKMTTPSIVGNELAFKHCSEQYDRAITRIYWTRTIDTICGLRDCVQIDHKLYSTPKDIY